MNPKIRIMEKVKVLSWEKMTWRRATRALKGGSVRGAKLKVCRNFFYWGLNFFMKFLPLRRRMEILKKKYET